jgi:pyruvate carboxylase subunit B
MGYPPLVTPTSQIVGTQATLNVLTGERYKVITTETKNYFLGLYGRAPGQVDRNIMARAVGNEEPIKTRPADRLDPELEAVRKDLPASAQSLEDQLSFVLFPAIRGAGKGRSGAGTPRSRGSKRTGRGRGTPPGAC